MRCPSCRLLIDGCLDCVPSNHVASPGGVAQALAMRLLPLRYGAVHSNRCLGCVLHVADPHPDSLPSPAGWDTSAHTIAFTCGLIAEHSEAENKIAAELESLGLLASEREPSPRQIVHDDLALLTYTSAVIKVSRPPPSAPPRGTPSGWVFPSSQRPSLFIEWGFC